MIVNQINVKPYITLMRLDKPIGSLLLLWPTLWALWIASEGLPRFSLLLIFTLGVIVMRSAGCVVNDIADRNFDGKVARTCKRPLVTGAVSLKQAIVLFLILCMIGLLLVLQLNWLTVELSIGALFLAIFYPFTKRITYLPQLVLGAAFAWSVPMAFAAATNKISNMAWLLYLIAVTWPVAYDSIYALMDKEDDLKVGIKSSVILFGRWDVGVILLLQFLVVLGLVLLGIFLQFKIFYYGGIFVAAIMMAYQIRLVQNRNHRDYYRAFHNNHWVGFVILLGIILNYLA